MPTVHSAPSAAVRVARFAPYFWTHADAADAVMAFGYERRSSAEAVNGQSAVLFVHPFRMHAVLQYLASEPVTVEEAEYLAYYLAS
jgi:hypothetical protein